MTTDNFNTFWDYLLLSVTISCSLWDIRIKLMSKDLPKITALEVADNPDYYNAW